jgi:hypothetical protein
MASRRVDAATTASAVRFNFPDEKIPLFLRAAGKFRLCESGVETGRLTAARPRNYSQEIRYAALCSGICFHASVRGRTREKPE